MVFHIPYDCGERMGFGVTILLSITIYLLVISEHLPEKSDNTPMLGVVFISEFYNLSVALVMAGVTNILSRRKTEPPKCLLILTNRSNNPCKKKKKDEEAIPMQPSNGCVGIEQEHEEQFQKEKRDFAASGNRLPNLSIKYVSRYS